ncbi:hypothetical protein AMECASPLE_035986 [Ameca splendens]|uniref:Uncharacterized protein n=1 Tax=Ameca splendens TaxID=208324 RepID=A0ABV0ZTF4_9TELE
MADFHTICPEGPLLCPASFQTICSFIACLLTSLFVGSPGSIAGLQTASSFTAGLQTARSFAAGLQTACPIVAGLQTACSFVTSLQKACSFNAGLLDFLVNERPEFLFLPWLGSFLFLFFGSCFFSNISVYPYCSI